MDLGDIYEIFDEVVAGGWLPGGADRPNIDPKWFAGTPDPATTGPGQVNGGGGAWPTQGPGNLKWNPRTGKWEKCGRRRRKRLASASDIKDLASLKAVLGNGDAFKTWIATH
jgi:hypothetical protein